MPWTFGPSIVPRARRVVALCCALASGALALGLGGCASGATGGLPGVTPLGTPGATSTPAPVRRLTWSIERELPHDPEAFTQGLLWHEGRLYESTGLEGRSSLREVDLETGQVLRRRDLPAPLFAEGLALVGDELFQLTWKNGVAFVYDFASFEPRRQLRYRGEGWGLTFDGRHLIQSDGSNALFWREPSDFSIHRTVRVTRNGLPLRNLNELEWIGGFVWSNVWLRDEIVVIDPSNGRVVAELDLAPLRARMTLRGGEDVLNGIAYDPATGRLFVTGKNWPTLFQLRVAQIPGVD